MTTEHRSWLARWFWPLYLLGIAALIAGVFYGTAGAQTARTATITFTAPTGRTDGSTITGALSYEVYQGLKGQPRVKVGTITATATTISTGLLGGNEYCWDIVTIEAGNPTPSAHSAEACKLFDQSGPDVVTITVT